MNKKTIRVLAITAASVLSIGTLAVATAEGATKTLTIAFQGPLTGDNAQAGVDELAGAKYAAAVYNASKPAVKIILKEVDDQGSGSQAAIVAPGVAKDKSVVGLIGSAFSGATLNSFPSYKAAGLPMVSPSASRVSLTVPTDVEFGGPVFHRVVANDLFQGPALARLAQKGVANPTSYLVDDLSPYGVGLRDAAIKGIKMVAGKDSVDAATTDYSSTTAKVLASKANVVIYFGYDKGAGLFLKSLKDGGYKGTFATGDGSATQTFPDTAGNAEGALITQADTPFDNIATAAQKKAFTAASGVKVAGGYVTTAINAFNVFATCIKAGKTTRAAILTCINTGKFPNFTGGTFSFDANGDIKGGAPVGAFTIKNGKIVYVGQA